MSCKMISRIIIASIVIFAALSIAQDFGSVGEKKIDKDFISELQYTNPEFSFSPDSSAFVKKLRKAYVYDKFFAEKAREEKLAEKPRIRRKINNIKKLVEDAVLAEIYREKLSEKNIDVNEKEIREYYQNNIDEFTEPAIYSYIWATLHDTSEANIRYVRKKLNKYKSLGESLDEFKMGSSEKYSMAYEPKRQVGPNDRLYETLKQAKPMKIIGPFRNNNKMMLMVLVDVIPERVVDFNKVNGICRQRVIEKKRMQEYDRLLEKASEEYKIRLNLEYFESSR